MIVYLQIQKYFDIIYCIVKIHDDSYVPYIWLQYYLCYKYFTFEYALENTSAHIWLKHNCVIYIALEDDFDYVLASLWILMVLKHLILFIVLMIVLLGHSLCFPLEWMIFEHLNFLILMGALSYNLYRSTLIVGGILHI